MMSDKIDWMQKLGGAFLGQQKNIMDAVQRLRAKTQAAGNLQPNAQQKVIVEPAEAAFRSARANAATDRHQDRARDSAGGLRSDVHPGGCLRARLAGRDRVRRDRPLDRVRAGVMNRYRHGAGGGYGNDAKEREGGVHGMQDDPPE